jgi:hypothetical protein
MWTDEWVEEARDWICSIYSEWRDAYPTQEPFPKLHDMIAHIMDFVERERMYGRLSEESFESSHQRIKKEKANTTRIADSKLRSEVLARRLQLSMKESVETVSIDVRKKLTSRYKKRSKTYRNKGSGSNRRDNDTISVSNPVPNQEEGGDSSDIILINEDTAIKREWLDAWQLAVKGRVPESWHKGFDAIDDLIGNVTAESCRYLTHT